jgi:hypothetical protein
MVLDYISAGGRRGRKLGGIVPRKFKSKQWYSFREKNEEERMFFSDVVGGIIVPQKIKSIQLRCEERRLSAHIRPAGDELVRSGCTNGVGVDSAWLCIL